MPALDEGTPLFVQIADQLADDIVDGQLAEGTRVPSTNELAAFYRINPATAAKGINMLVDDGVLEKRRGIGMFVAAGAQEQLRAMRRSTASFSAGAAPKTLTTPPVGNSSPVIMRSRVVFPAPLRPSSPVTVPGSTVSETLSSAAWSR